MTRGHAPAAERNRGPIRDILRSRMHGPVLEVAAGTGQHARWLSDDLGLDWTPTDCTPDALESIAAWREGGPDRLHPPRHLDVLDVGTWPVERGFGAVLAINLVHISPWEVTGALFRLAAAVLDDHGAVHLYGPYRVDGAHTAESNVRFDAWLRERDPRFGVRDLEAVAAVAADAGLPLVERIAMPANNLVLRFARQRSGS